MPDYYLGQNYEAFLADTIDWLGAVTATYIGIPLFLIIWFGYKRQKGTRFVRYSGAGFPGTDLNNNHFLSLARSKLSGLSPQIRSCIS